MGENPTITAIGSCRVHAPVKLMHDAGLATLNNHCVFGFTHTIHEVLQAFDFIEKAKTPPSDLLPYLNATERSLIRTGLDPVHHFETTDVFVVEISSPRELPFQDYFLHIHRTASLLGQAPRKRWWGDLLSHGVNDWQAHIDFEPDDAIGKAVFRSLRRWELREEEVLAGVAKIADRLRGRPVVFVPHVIYDEVGYEIPLRVKLAEMLRAAAIDAGALFYDPSVAVAKYGFAAAMKDSGHYQPEFERHLGIELLNFVRR